MDPTPEPTPTPTPPPVPAPAAPTPPAPAAPADPTLAKFWTDNGLDVDKLSKSYVELEKRLSNPSPAPNPAPEAPDPLRIPAAPEPASPLPGSAGELLNKVGLDEKTISEQWAKDGSLTDEQYEAFAKQGVPKFLVDSHIKSIEMERQVVLDKLVTRMGGREQFDNLIDTASKDTTLTDDERKWLNDNLASSATAHLAIDALRARYSSSMGRGVQATSQHSTSPNGETYYSLEQLVADRGTFRYQNDPAYRKWVDAKAARSPNLK